MYRLVNTDDDTDARKVQGAPGIDLTDGDFQTILTALTNSGEDCRKFASDMTQPCGARIALEESAKSYLDLRDRLEGI